MELHGKVGNSQRGNERELLSEITGWIYCWECKGQVCSGLSMLEVRKNKCLSCFSCASKQNCFKAIYSLHQLMMKVAFKDQI